MKKRWYFILTIVWIAFWTLDIFFLIPQSPVSEMRLFATDDLAFSIYWLWISAPISLYLLVMGAVKLSRFIARICRRAIATL